jgi:hypothetical protein
MQGLRAAFGLLLSCTFASQGTAGTAAGEFSVSVKPVGICIGVGQSNAAQAEVRVTCQGLEFVSIEARSGRPFVGTHGGAYRYTFSGSSLPMLAAGSASSLEDRVGQGTITAFRVMNLTESDEQPQFLITF